MTLLRHFIINGKYLGNSPQTLERIKGGWLIPQSYLFFCWKCGEVYAKAPVVDSETNKEEPFQAWRLCCSRCPPESSYSSLPGSVWLGWLENYCKELPEEVVRYEFKLILEAK